uniref:Guanine nucleotide exchange factor VAV2 n=2 Tax=Steinernema glaseri TaxID=37863 RepID=A0A1I7ZPA8_9BILA
MPPSGDLVDTGGVPVRDDLWRDCVRWLRSCRALPAVFAVSDLREFALRLRDGVVLIRLANMLESGCIAEATSTLTSSQFISNRFISLFIDACVNRFGISRANVFTTDDLYKMENFGKVLRTLSLLSYTDLALAICPEPFPQTESPSSSRTSSVADYYNNEAIYQSLQKAAEDDDDGDENIYDMGRVVADEEQEKHGDIYDTIVVSQRPTRIADLWDTFHPQSRREHCIKELLDTEINYVDNALGRILNNYYVPLKPHLTEVQRETIFMNISEISMIHNSFRNDLKRAVFATVGLEEKSGVKDIGAVFIEHKERFVVYGRYCASMNNSRSMIDELLRTNNNIKQLVEDCARRCGTQFLLQDLMCVPMQRILKYHMLLKQLIDCTPVDSPDRKSLDDAHEAMQDINGYINEVRRDYESQQVIAEIQKSIPDIEMPANMCLSSYGRLIKDGEIKMAFLKDGAKLKNRYIFIFDKVMLVCKLQRNSQYSYKSAHVLKKFTVDMENENNNRFNTLTRKFGTAGSYPFFLNPIPEHHRNSDNGAGSKDQIQLSCKTMNQRHAWVHAFETANEHVMPRAARQSHHKVVYKTFPPATTCTTCRKLLHGLYFQGYACEVCTGIFHRDCLKYTCSGGRSHSTPGLQHRSSDLGARLRNVPSNLGSEFVGEVVIAKETISSMDPAVLSFEKHDKIEVIRLLDGGTFYGRLVTAPGKAGIVRVDSVRRARNSSHSMSMSSLHNHASQSSIQRHESTVLPSRQAQAISRMSSSSFTSAHSPQREYYVNMSVNNQPWYFGPLSREVAHTRLFGKTNGTFIVRFSANQDRYAISISYLNDVKHTKVEFEGNKYYLDESRQFDSLVELVNYYRENNLSESFEHIDTVLTAPLIQSRIYRVVHDYSPTEPKFLTMRHGELVTVLDTSGEDKGWWKGRIDNRTGFFPYAYVAAYFEDDDSATENGSL